MTDLTDAEIMELFEAWKDSTRAEVASMVEAKFKEVSLNTTMNANRKTLADIEGRIRVLEKAQPPLKRLKRFLGL